MSSTEKRGAGGAPARLARLLAVVPWIVAQAGPTVQEVCERFGYDQATLTSDLDLLFLCGVHPFTPDTLIEADIADGRVWIRYADYFARPLRLTPVEALTLVASGAAQLAVPGSDPDGPLGRALAKLAAVVGVAPEEVVEVDVGGASADTLAVMRVASVEHRQVRIEYYSFGRDAWTTRTIDPHTVYSAEGQWYVLGWCHQVQGPRRFRIDRIRSTEVLDTSFTPRPLAGVGATFTPDPSHPVAVLELTPAANWVVDQYPNEGVERLPNGRIRVRLRVAERAWLERLLLRLGPEGRVVEGPVDVGPAAAARVLRRYGSSPGGG